MNVVDVRPPGFMAAVRTPATFFLIAILAGAGLGASASHAANVVDVKAGRPGAPGADTVYLGAKYEFRVGIENDVILSGMSLGMNITSPDGVRWRWDSQPDGYGPSGRGTGGQYLTVVPQSRMDPTSTVWDFTNLLVVEQDMDGISPDTIFPGAASLNGGLPAGPIQHMMSIHFTAQETGPGDVGTICVDSCFVPPAGDFLFVDASNAGSITPSFFGPHCWPVAQNPGLAPMIVVAFSPVNIIIVDPEGLQFGKDAAGNLIDEIDGAAYYENPRDSVVIDQPRIGDYDVRFVTEDGASEQSTYSAIIKIDGLQESTIVADQNVPETGSFDSFGYTVEEEYHYVNGDANGDEIVNIMDVSHIVRYIFSGGDAPDPEASADANCDGVVNVEDAVYVVNYIFRGGAEPCYFDR